MTVRFAITVNGELLCTTGIEGNGVLSNIITYAKRKDEEAEVGLSAGGLGTFDQHSDKRQHVEWLNQTLQVGDEITIKLLPPGTFDPPTHMRDTPAATKDDPTFGHINYRIDAWRGQVEVECAPFSHIHLYIRGTQDGPTEAQQALYQQLIDTHHELWPKIANALTTCHTSIQTVAELNKRIVPNFAIDMPDDASHISINYHVEQDPPGRSYVVVLRDGELTEISTLG